MHQHQWGPWHRARTTAIGYIWMRKRHRYCVNGMCPIVQYRNGVTVRMKSPNVGINFPRLRVVPS